MFSNSPLWAICPLVDYYRQTVLYCNRQLLTCDERDAEIVFGAMKLIYSWNDNDPINQVPLKHITRGFKSVKLIGSRMEFPAALENSQNIEFRMGNVTVPNTDNTVYWCKTIPFAQPATKHHVIKFGELFLNLNYIVNFLCVVL